MWCPSGAPPLLWRSRGFPLFGVAPLASQVPAAALMGGLKLGGLKGRSSEPQRGGIWCGHDEARSGTHSRSPTRETPPREVLGPASWASLFNASALLLLLLPFPIRASCHCPHLHSSGASGGRFAACCTPCSVPKRRRSEGDKSERRARQPGVQERRGLFPWSPLWGQIRIGGRNNHFAHQAGVWSSVVFRDIQ